MEEMIVLYIQGKDCVPELSKRRFVSKEHKNQF